jgi:hypothetical protein
MVLVPKTFECDDSVLDPVIKAHIATLYAAVDKKETLDLWGQHFAEDAELKKGPVNVKGRASKYSLLIYSSILEPKMP